MSPVDHRGPGLGRAREAQLKGVNFHGTLDALARRFGAETRSKVEARVRGEAGEALRTGAIVSGGWYPASFYDALLRAIEEELPIDRVVHDLAYDAVTHDFKTIFRIVSLVPTPGWALEGATRLVTKYVQGGRVKVLVTEEGLFHARFEDFHGYTARMKEDFAGGVEAIMDLMRYVRQPTRFPVGAGDGPVFEILVRYTRR